MPQDNPDVGLYCDLPYPCQDWNTYLIPSKINGRGVKALEVLAVF